MARVDQFADADRIPEPHVPETRFGIWFLKTWVWTVYVLQRAVDDLNRLIPDRRASYPVILDVGCGSGQSLPLLQTAFRPERMIGVDIDPLMVERASGVARKHGLTVDFHRASNACLPLDDRSVDMVFCHQSFHHLVEQHAALREFYRVLKPGGVLLFAESTRKFIYSWSIRLLFRHPMEVQRTAKEYIAMVRQSGFAVGDDAISFPNLWWSRADIGILELVFRIRPSADRLEPLVNLVGVRPE